MEDACINCNVIEFVDKEKQPRQKDEGPLSFQAPNDIGIVV
jgi:hypothetical protein